MDLLVGGARAQEVPGLVFTHWWVRLGLRASVSPLVGRARSQELAAKSQGSQG